VALKVCLALLVAQSGLKVRLALSGLRALLGLKA
jgi:hypothetical protein